MTELAKSFGRNGFVEVLLWSMNLFLWKESLCCS